MNLPDGKYAIEWLSLKDGQSVGKQEIQSKEKALLNFRRPAFEDDLVAKIEGIGEARFKKGETRILRNTSNLRGGIPAFAGMTKEDGAGCPTRQRLTV